MFQTDGDPPSMGSINRPMIGWTENTSAAEMKMARPNTSAVVDGLGACVAATVSVISYVPDPIPSAGPGYPTHARYPAKLPCSLKISKRRRGA